jgi:hypothetical protein
VRYHKKLQFTKDSTGVRREYRRPPKTNYFFIAAMGFIFLIFVSPVAAQSKQVVGWLENVCIYPGDLIIRAKLDTGARNSSLNASHITEFGRNGKQWVRFTVISRYGNTATIEKKIHRIVKIKDHHGKPQLRFAILLGISLGSLHKEVEVNLADRSFFNYQMLIGRSFLEGHVIVDPSVKFTTKPICKGVRRQ